MARNFRGTGEAIDFPYIVQTGVTITAGSLIWVDVSGTNVVHRVRSHSGASAETASPATGVGICSLDITQSGTSGIWIGVMANTQTGTTQAAGGHQTGIAVFTEGVFEYVTTPTASANLRVGYPVFAVDHETVRGAGVLDRADPTGTNATGSYPIGFVTFFPAGPHVTNTAVRVQVKVNARRTQQQVF
jgi:hypothetical protein